MGRKKKSRNTAVKAVWTLAAVLAVVAVLLFLGEKVIVSVKQKAAGTVLSHLAQEEGSLPASGEPSLGQIYNQMDEEDREVLSQIIADNINEQTVQDVQEYVESGDTSGLLQYVEENLSEQDSQKVEELYEKYKDQIPK